MTHEAPSLNLNKTLVLLICSVLVVAMLVGVSRYTPQRTFSTGLLSRQRSQATEKGAIRLQKISGVPPDGHFCEERIYQPSSVHEWSIDKWQKSYCQALASAVWPPANESQDRNILFVDAREECERYRELLITIRQSAFLGHIVLLVYYPEDQGLCSRLTADFEAEVFYYPSPRWEWTLFMYHGVVNYFRQYPNTTFRYKMSGVVRPEYIAWCSNPFEDVSFSAQNSLPGGLVDRFAPIGGHRKGNDERNNLTIFATFFKDPRLTALKPRHRSFFGKRVMNDQILIGTPYGLFHFMDMILTEAMNTPRTSADPSWSFTLSSLKIENYTNTHVTPLLPITDYAVEDCGVHGWHSLKCLPYERGVRIRNGQCFVNYPREIGPIPSSATNTLIANTPNQHLTTSAVRLPSYSPYCYIEYRYAISEVPDDASIVDHALPTVKLGAEKLKNAIQKAKDSRQRHMFSVPLGTEQSLSSSTDSLSAHLYSGKDLQCPNGTLAVLSMLGTYKMDKVSDFIAAFLHYAEPNCTKLILLVTALTGVHKVVELYPSRIEVVWYTAPNSPYTPTHLAGRGVVEERYEVAQLWLEKHIEKYRYVMNVDSRDFIFMSDPLSALHRVLSHEGFLGSEFVGIVTESIALGSFSGLSTDFGDLVNQCAQEWLRLACGPQCYAKLALMSYTNGEPFATVNSGQMLGTALGMLHYYRFHTAMVVESQYDFSSVDQGLVTFYLHGILKHVGYPHRILVFASSRSGFANPPHVHRLTWRYMITKNGTSELEYAFRDCSNQNIAGVHQSDRNKGADALARSSFGVKAAWAGWIANKSFEEYFQSPVQQTSSDSTVKKSKRPTKKKR